MARKQHTSVNAYRTPRCPICTSRRLVEFEGESRCVICAETRMDMDARFGGAPNATDLAIVEAWNAKASA
jgi:hypothetical protein